MKLSQGEVGLDRDLQRFLEYVRSERGLSQATIEVYALDLSRGFIPFMRRQGKLEASAITKEDIGAYLCYLMGERKNSNPTRARKLAAIKSFFNFLEENGRISINPAARLRSPKVSVKEPVYLSEDECIRLLQTVTQRAKPEVRGRDLAMVILFLATGLRASELCNLKLSDVNLGEKQIKTLRKGGKEQYLNLNPEATMALTQYVMARDQSKNGWLFPSIGGQQLKRASVYGMVRKYLKLANIDKGKWGPHMLRHSFCTILHQKGVDPFVIKNLAGHKSLQTTMRYVRIGNDEETEALGRLVFGIFGPLVDEDSTP